MKLATVNVIETIDGHVWSIDSFSDDESGNKEAGELFILKAKENGMKDGDIDFGLEEGYFVGDEPYAIYITHSS